MGFIMTEEWLMEYYGSLPSQVSETRKWLLAHGKNIPGGVIDTWARFKHLSEYQPNTPNIVPEAMSMIGKEYPSELVCHRIINLMRVPIAQSYIDALQDGAKSIPTHILELGVGGDSGISTSVFLAWAEVMGGSLTSIDRNPLGVTWKRYEKYHGSLWQFFQMDSKEFLSKVVEPFDLIFVDTSHSFRDTYTELDLASKLTNFMLLDDALFEGNHNDPEPGGVKRAIEEWSKDNSQDWSNIKKYWNGMTVLFSKKTTEGYGMKPFIKVLENTVAEEKSEKPKKTSKKKGGK